MDEKKRQGYNPPPMPGMPLGIPTGKLGKYSKAPDSDKNHVMEEKGSMPPVSQLGWASK